MSDEKIAEFARTAAMAANDELWTEYTPEEKEALLGLAFHAIDANDSGFNSRHAKFILALMVKMSRGR